MYFIYFFRRSHLISHFGNFNNIEIYTNNVVDENLFKIILQFDDGSSAVIYQNGKTKEIPEEYGPQKIILIYNDSVSFEKPYMKLNRNHDHLYRFTFFRQNEVLYCDLNILGEDGERDTFKLKRIIPDNVNN